MGCSSSKQAHRDLRRSPSPLRRTHSVPAHRKANSHQFVSLTSSTPGSVELHSAAPDTSPDRNTDEEMQKRGHDKVGGLPAELAEAKTWSEKIQCRIPRTPTVTPPNEPESINAWELMAGLEDLALSMRGSPVLPSPALDRRSFSFSTTREASPAQESIPNSRLGSPGVGDFISTTQTDPKIISTFRMALEELSPQHPAVLLRSPEPRNVSSRRGNLSVESTGIVQARVRAFQEEINAKKAVRRSQSCPSGSEGKVVVYFTSLRGVRRTYEDCCWVKEILKGYGVRVDERDVSMDRTLREELDEFVGAAEGGGRVLPTVFADGRYLGGADEVRRMHEAEELGKALRGCEAVADGGGGPCEGCGGVRFVPCGRCSGSCKVYVEEEEEEELVEEEEVGGGFVQCPNCNENGIVRCPFCC